ncbi:MAG: hypothetical protein JO314_13120 [Acidobacteria bacterium]|nr:hypothetical protein [Acidobacteriota bacterium]
MKKLTLIFVLVFAGTAISQRTFDIKDASQYFDVKVKVAKCDDQFCSGRATFSFYKKGGTTPYQVITLPDTNIDISDGGPAVNTTMLYDKQSVIDVGDYNFDGMEDIALCNGTNGAYGMPSYNVYLSNRAAGKFVYSPALSELAHGLGMFEVLKDKKQLETLNKDGCCWHITERYKVVANRPVKVWEEVEDARGADQSKVKVTTKELVNGRWKTTVKWVKAEDQL